MHPRRQALIDHEKKQPYMQLLKQTLIDQMNSGTTIYPTPSLIFNALAQTSRDDLSVVILGQDPYHGPGQAMGLSFSVPRGVSIPPSLKNIYKEIQQSTRHTPPTHGDLTHRAAQGVLLLNAILTVQAGNAASHRKIGREQFTDTVIQTISQEKDGIVFLLRGAFAQSKQSLIDSTRHTILTAPHPSPLSAYRGFLGSHHFVRTNQILTAAGRPPIQRTG